MRRALAIYGKSSGSKDPVLLTDLNGLARLLEDQGRWSEAPVFREYAKPIMTVGANELSRMRLQKMAVALNNSNLRYHARALYHADAGDAANLAEGFELSQWVCTILNVSTLGQRRQPVG
jgi:hypothetical protein